MTYDELLTRGLIDGSRLLECVRKMRALPDFQPGNVVLISHRITDSPPWILMLSHSTFADVSEMVREDRTTNDLPTVRAEDEVVAYWFDADRQCGTFHIVRMARDGSSDV